MTSARSTSPTKIDWLRGLTLPSDWSESKVKYVAPAMQAGESITAESIETAGTYPVYGGNGLRGYTETKTHDGTRILIGRQGALCGNVHLVSGEFWASEHAIVVRAADAVDPRWLAYLLRVMNLGQYSQTAAQPGIGTAQISALPMPLPAFSEQGAIADYLDRETARIDALIEEQQCLIEMLRGRRKAVIERTVFSGLASVPTKSNAEPWLAPTPSHWRIVELGFVSDTVAGYAFPSDGFSADEDHVRLLRGVNVKPGRIDWTETVYWDVEAAPAPGDFVLEVGDLVFGMDRPFVGGGARVSAVSGDDLPALLLQRVMRIRPHDEAGRGYMYYVLSTDAFHCYLEPLFTGVSVPHVSEWQVRKFKMPFPPLVEQKHIAAYLNEQTTTIDTLLDETVRFIELARERRAALITAAVTGQIDVREMV